MSIEAISSVAWVANSRAEQTLDKLGPSQQGALLSDGGDLPVNRSHSSSLELGGFISHINTRLQSGFLVDDLKRLSVMLEKAGEPGGFSIGESHAALLQVSFSLSLAANATKLTENLTRGLIDLVKQG